MIIFAVWATVESIATRYDMVAARNGEYRSELYKNPDNVQNINNGWIIGLGAICGTIGFMIQYFCVLPYVDASMTATAALILKQATGGVGGGASEEEVIAKAEVAAILLQIQLLDNLAKCD